MEYSKAIDVITECRDVLEMSLKLLNSDFSFIEDENVGSIIVNVEGYIYPEVCVGLRAELNRVIKLLKKL